MLCLRRSFLEVSIDRIRNGQEESLTCFAPWRSTNRDCNRCGRVDVLVVLECAVRRTRRTLDLADHTCQLHSQPWSALSPNGYGKILAVLHAKISTFAISAQLWGELSCTMSFQDTKRTYCSISGQLGVLLLRAQLAANKCFVCSSSALVKPRTCVLSDCEATRGYTTLKIRLPVRANSVRPRCGTGAGELS